MTETTEEGAGPRPLLVMGVRHQASLTPEQRAAMKDQVLWAPEQIIEATRRQMAEERWRGLPRRVRRIRRRLGDMAKRLAEAFQVRRQKEV